MGAPDIFRWHFDAISPDVSTKSISYFYESHISPDYIHLQSSIGSIAHTNVHVKRGLYMPITSMRNNKTKQKGKSAHTPQRRNGKQDDDQRMHNGHWTLDTRIHILCLMLAGVPTINNRTDIQSKRFASKRAVVHARWAHKCRNYGPRYENNLFRWFIFYFFSPPPPILRHVLKLNINHGFLFEAKCIRCVITCSRVFHPCHSSRSFPTI